MVECFSIFIPNVEKLFSNPILVDYVGLERKLNSAGAKQIIKKLRQQEKQIEDDDTGLQYLVGNVSFAFLVVTIWIFEKGSQFIEEFSPRIYFFCLT